MSLMRQYYMMTKPGIIFGNAVTAVGGFVLASRGALNGQLFFWTLLGLSLIVGSGCVLNNFLDRVSDRLMHRTRHRALAKGTISPNQALVFALVLGSLGTLILLFFTNLLATCIALMGFLVYVAFYSLVKYHTVHGTLIGSIAGAVPPVVGYCAVSDRFDLAAALLFIILVLWQMPHFFAIAIYRIEEYAAASVPVLPIKKGAYRTKVQMLAYVIAFGVGVSCLTAFGYTGRFCLIISLLLSCVWAWISLQGFKAKNDKAWARQMFLFSLVVIMGLCTMISVDTMIAI